MDRENMLKRIEAGYNPIDISIEKWKDGVGLDSMTNCAMCEVHYGHNVGNPMCSNCYGCPLYEIGDGCMEDNSSFLKATKRGHGNEVMITALQKAKEYDMQQLCKEHEVTPKVEQKTYEIGDRFTYGSDTYMIARMYKEHGLINLSSGNIWSNSIKVDNSYAITQREFDDMCGSQSGSFIKTER